MTVKKYIERQAKIVKEETGLSLLPKEQVVDLSVSDKMVQHMGDWLSLAEKPGFKGTLLDTHNSPYCVEYLLSSEDESCEGCPVHEAGNNCFDAGSTYVDANMLLQKRGRDNSSILGKLVKLAQEFEVAHLTKENA